MLQVTQQGEVFRKPDKLRTISMQCRNILADISVQCHVMIAVQQTLGLQIGWLNDIIMVACVSHDCAADALHAISIASDLS